jgi:hypothetical protein
MTLNNLLTKNRQAIINRWLELIFETYPEFVKKEKDQFANPIGYTIKKGIEEIFDWLIQKDDVNRLFPVLESIIKIKAVEENTPSSAISFIFLLKQVIREKLKIEDLEIKELLAFEAKIDKLANISFDIFMKCKEKIYELKTKSWTTASFGQPQWLSLR